MSNVPNFTAISPIPTPAEIERRRVYALEHLANSAERFVSMFERIEKVVMELIAKDQAERRQRRG